MAGVPWPEEPKLRPGPSYSAPSRDSGEVPVSSLKWGHSSQLLLQELLPQLSTQLVHTGHCWRPPPCQVLLLLCPTAACPPWPLPPRPTG